MKGILMYASWVAGPVLQITLLLFMFRRKWHGVFPRFFSYIIDMFWLVTPSFFPERFHISWLDVVAPIGIGGIWLAAFIRNLKGQPMLALNDPRFEHGMNIQNASHD